jgi:very-short-patch-repair endonuclease
MRNRIIKYNPALKELARKLRKEGTLSEILLWKQIKGKQLGVEFHRQVPIDEYIVDFYCHEISLAIEIDGISHNDLIKDDNRQAQLEELGVRFIRFPDRDVKTGMQNVIRTLEHKIEQLKTD